MVATIARALVDKALDETSIAAKAVIRDFYGTSPSYSYFDGCSDGGREALMEAQRYPLDFEGIIAGSPANYWTHLMVGFVWNEQALLNQRSSYIPGDKLPALQAASLAACDAIDQIRDGIVEDPRLCHFNPVVLLCKSGVDNSACLTAAQVEAARKIYSGPRNPATGRQIFPGYEPGAEASLGDWPAWIIGSWPNGGWQFSLGNMFFADMVFKNPRWDFRTLNFSSDVAITDASQASVINSTNPDLHSFKARGGKLIQYHGWADAAIAPINSIHYYQSVAQTMGGLEEIRDFYRLYMVPGMSHCAGGPGPNSFGGILQYHFPNADAEDDVVNALMRWVEQGVAPDRIIATKFRDGISSKGILLTRPLCPYPERARWNENSNPNDSSSFVCR